VLNRRKATANRDRLTARRYDPPPGGAWKEDGMTARGLHHLDLAVADVERSVASYLALLGSLGLREMVRYPTYRGTEDVVYLGVDTPILGFRPADG